MDKILDFIYIERGSKEMGVVNSYINIEFQNAEKIADSIYTNITKDDMEESDDDMDFYDKDVILAIQI